MDLLIDAKAEINKVCFENSIIKQLTWWILKFYWEVMKETLKYSEKLSIKLRNYHNK